MKNTKTSITPTMAGLLGRAIAIATVLAILATGMTVTLNAQTPRPLTITTSLPSSIEAGKNSAVIKLTATGGTPPYTWDDEGCTPCTVSADRSTVVLKYAWNATLGAHTEKLNIHDAGEGDDQQTVEKEYKVNVTAFKANDDAIWNELLTGAELKIEHANSRLSDQVVPNLQALVKNQSQRFRDLSLKLRTMREQQLLDAKKYKYMVYGMCGMGVSMLLMMVAIWFQIRPIVKNMKARGL